MARLLIVHHTPSPAMETMFRAVVEGTAAEGIEGVQVECRAALGATASDVLDADGFILGTPANLGYMSGALKHFFDTIYYPCLEQTRRRPYGIYIHGNNDVEGALLGVQKIATGLEWRAARKPVRIIGEPTAGDIEACWELGASVAAGLMA